MKSYMFPCNLGKYDVLGSFLKNGFVDYGTRLNLEIGDQVYIYTGAPYSGIFLKCMVRNVLKAEETIDDEEFIFDDNSGEEIPDKPRYVRLIPVKNYLNKIDKVNSDKLRENGVKGFAFQILLSQETVDYLESL